MKALLLTLAAASLSWMPLTGRAVEIPTPGLAAPRQPQVAIGRDGRGYVVFGDGAAIYCASAALPALEFAAPVKIAELPKLALGMRRGPRIVAAGGSLVVTAISHAEGRVYGWRSIDAGQSWRAIGPINTVENSAREGLHALAGTDGGFVICVWLDLRAGGMELWSRVSRDGGVEWQPEVRVYASPDGSVCQCCVPGVAIGPRGEIAVLWRNALGGARDMWTAASSDGGHTFAAAHKLGEGTWTLQACPMDGGGLAIAPDGALLTAWRRERTVFASGSLGPETKLADDAAQPLVVSNGVKPATLWEKDGALWLRVGADAARLLARPARMAAAAPQGAGFLVVWEEPHGATQRLRAERIE